MGLGRLVGRWAIGPWLLVGGLVASVGILPALTIAQEPTGVPQEQNQPPAELPLTIGSESDTATATAPIAEEPRAITPSPTSMPPTLETSQTVAPTGDADRARTTSEIPTQIIVLGGEALPRPESTSEPIPNSDTLSALSTAGHLSLSEGGEQSITLAYTVTSPRVATSIHVDLRHEGGIPATAWWLRGQAGGSRWATGGGAIELVENQTLSPGASFGVTVVVTAPSELNAEQTVSLHVSSTITTPIGTVESAVGGDTPVASLTATPNVPALVVEADTGLTGADFRLSCLPEAIASTIGVPVDVRCSLQASDALGERVVTLVEIEVAGPHGWTVSGAGTTTGSTGTVIRAESSHDFAFTVTPDGCDADSGAVTVSTLLAPEGGEAFPGPPAELPARVSAPFSQPPAVDVSPLVFGTARITGDGYEPLTGSLTLTLTSGDPECADVPGMWVLQVSTDGLYHADTGDLIPAAALTYRGVTPVTSAAGALVSVDAGVPLGPGPVTIAHLVSAGRVDGTWTVHFTLDPPDDKPPGVYRGTVTFTIVNET